RPVPSYTPGKPSFVASDSLRPIARWIVGAVIVWENAVTLKKKIFLSITALLSIAIVSFAIVISHDSPCVAPPALAEGKAGMKAVVRTCYGGPEKLALASLEKPE